VVDITFSWYKKYLIRQEWYNVVIGTELYNILNIVAGMYVPPCHSFIHSSGGKLQYVASHVRGRWLAGRCCPTAWGLPMILIGIEDTFEWEKQHIVVVVVVVLVLLL
jgi:hypothetical protein